MQIKTNEWLSSNSCRRTAWCIAYVIHRPRNQAGRVRRRPAWPTAVANLPQQRARRERKLIADAVNTCRDWSFHRRRHHHHHHKHCAERPLESDASLIICFQSVLSSVLSFCTNLQMSSTCSVCRLYFITSGHAVISKKSNDMILRPLLILQIQHGRNTCHFSVSLSGVHFLFCLHFVKISSFVTFWDLLRSSYS